MATKITFSDGAPAEAARFTFATTSFELVGKKAYETDDPEIIEAAETHDWLKVTRSPNEIVIGAFHDQLKPEDDHLASLGSPNNPNDPDEARAAEEAKYEDEVVPVAIDASEPQKTVVFDGPIAKTLAADPTSKTSTNVKDKD